MSLKNTKSATKSRPSRNISLIPHKKVSLRGEITQEGQSGTSLGEAPRRGINGGSIQNTEENDFFIFIRSNDCTTYTLNTHLSFKIEPQITCLPDEHFHISVHGAEIPYSWYSITDENNEMTYTESTSGVPETESNITVPIGNYSIRDLILEIQTLMNLGTKNSTVYSLTYSKITNKVTFSTVTADRSVSFDFTAEDSLAPHIGFTKTTHSLTTVTDLASDKAVQVFLEHNLYVRIPSLKFISNLSTKNGSSHISNILAKIPINAPPNSNIYYSPPFMSSNRLADKTLSFVEIYLTDDDGNLMDLNGLDWELTLHIRKSA